MKLITVYVLVVETARDEVNSVLCVETTPVDVNCVLHVETVSP